MQPEDIIGARFYKLLVLRRAESNKDRRSQWECLCDCGKKTVVTGRRLRLGDTKSCGCLSGEKHGRFGTKEYKMWASIIERCENSNSRSYPRYGGRGITMCARWRSSFTSFLSDMGECPKTMSIGRIDNDGPYSPENCRWETHEEQMNNRSGNRIVTAFGESLTLARWWRKTGIHPNSIKYRIDVQGWSAERALSDPVKKRAKKTLK